MKNLILILAFLACSFTSFAQSMYSDAVECMNNGEYVDAKIYWEALNDRNNTYGYKIVVCSVCIHLQSEAKKLIAAERFTKAIEKYQAILSKNPSDRNARDQIAKCKRLRAEYLETNKILTYTNSAYGYTFKLPSYMKKSANSNDERIDFWSNDYNLHATITARVYNSSQTDNQILNNVINSYLGATITYKKLKENCIVVSGYLADGLVFYDKSIIASRKSQYNEYVKILISAVVKSTRNDSRGSDLAKYIYNDLIVKTTVSSVKTNETDYERWQRAKKINSKEGYDNYLRYAPYYSSYKEEANGRKALCEAREQYNKGMQSFSQSFAVIYFENAKKQFESGANYMTQSDKEMYLESYYKYCMSPNCSVNEIKQFINSYGWHPNIKVIRGCLVKALCAIGQYDSAKAYVQNNLNYPIWISERTSLTQKQWLRYIKAQKKENKSVSLTVGGQQPVNNSNYSMKGGSDNSSISKQIMGKVLNAKGEAMTGAAIFIKGTATGTIADMEGNYRIAAKPGDVLTFHFKRFKTQEITVGLSSTINVTLSK